MESATGALRVLLPKLAQLLTDEYNLHKNAKKDIQYVSKELERVHAALQMVGEAPPENLTELVKMWAQDVRELSYDMEDIVDCFLVRVQGTERPRKKGTNRIIKEMMQRITKAWAYSGIGRDIKDLKERVKEVAERRDRYKVDTIAPAGTTSPDPRITALYTQLTDLVGIDESKGELITRLTREDDTSSQQLRIISIVGFGGLGKTTLAKAVYDELRMQFNCTAFISVSQNPDTKKLLKDILYELDNTNYRSIHREMLDERQLIDRIREFIQNKRYFIVIDDIWSKEPWNILRCALVVENNTRSQIITTTRIIGVAEQVGGYCYELKPLSPESSKILFCRRIFGCQDKLPPQYSEVSEKILSKCGGVPLAIITASGFLANKLGNVKEWYKLCDSIGSGIGRNYDIENMKKILSLSYYDLPSHLKTCLLYLSIYPEDYEIGKERLIWKWIAEGFVQHEEGQSLFEIGESYFNELVNRSLVQPIYWNNHDPSTLDYARGPRSCRVHDMVLDLICSLSSEENFVTIVLGDNSPKTRSGSKIHRLCLNDTNWPPRNISRLNISKLRSLTMFGHHCIINSTPSSLQCYHLLRVLDLEGEYNNLRGHSSLRFIGNLVHLRYLRLPWNVYTDEVLVEIGKLQFLQWLALGGADNICELPSSVLGLRQLMFLCVLSSTRLPAGLKNLTSLEVLYEVSVDSVQLAEELGHLTQLRFLSFHVKFKKDEEGRWDESLRTALVVSLGNLHKIQTLEIYNKNYASDLEGSMNSPLGNLRELIIRQIRLLPSWANPATLPILSRLEISVYQVPKQDIQVLGRLQALTYLKISGRGQPRVLERFIVAADAFPCLVECEFIGFSVAPSMFLRGAMPRLEKFGFQIDQEDFTGAKFCAEDLALGHLPSLKTLMVFLTNINDRLKTKLTEKLRHEVDVHPNHPFIEM